MSQNRSITRNHFYKEFPKGWEVEWKGNLVTKDPFGFIYEVYTAMDQDMFGDYGLPKVLGSLPTQIRCFNYLFHFYGHMENGVWVEDFVFAQPPGGDFYIPRIKTKEKIVLPFNHDPSIIIRIEKVKEDIRNRFSLEDVNKFIADYEKKHNIRIRIVGSIQRERFSFYAKNNISHRNWGIIADKCTLLGTVSKQEISQVEFEYKGINQMPKFGLVAQDEVLVEMGNLGQALINHIGAEKLIPTNLTKFDWIIESTLT